MSETNKTTHKVAQKDQKQTMENILRLQSLRDKLQGADLHKLDGVLQDLRNSVGDTVTKTNAAEMLQVSRQTVEKWVHEDLLPTVRGENGRQQIPRQAVERITEEVRSLRDLGHSKSVLAKALRSVADEIDAPSTNGEVKTAAKKKPAAKKPVAKQTATKKSPAKKPAAKKTVK